MRVEIIALVQAHASLPLEQLPIRSFYTCSLHATQRVCKGCDGWVHVPVAGHMASYENSEASGDCQVALHLLAAAGVILCTWLNFHQSSVTLLIVMATRIVNGPLQDTLVMLCFNESLVLLGMFQLLI